MTSLYSFTGRSASGIALSTAAPITEPPTDPIPPTTMNVIWRSAAEMPNSTGSMKPTTIACNPPATPA